MTEPAEPDRDLRPAIVLVRPQLADNIGMAARAMGNCGLADLRLVRPRPAMPHERAIAAATGAEAIVRAARVFDSVEAAVADLNFVYATTARTRDQVKPVVDVRDAAEATRARAAAGTRSGVLFGPERTGLENDEVSLADEILTVPLDPKFSSLNLAQAVLIVAYELFRLGAAAAPARPLGGSAVPATREELFGFFAHLESELDDCGFLRNAEMRPAMVRSLRNIFHRAGLMAHEVRSLQGVVANLARRPHDPTSFKAGGRSGSSRRGRAG